MRIDGNKAPGNVQRSRDTKGARSSGSVFSLEEAAGRSRSQSARGPAALGSIDALIALQSFDGEGGGRRSLSHGHEMLDQLDAIKLDLLAGSVPVKRLEDLLHSIRQRPSRAGDERLEALVDEIELRARVELAKLGREAA